jgi:adenine-specific DNA-methyltransferase
MSYNEGYVRNNIIRYLGNKRKLLSHIKDSIQQTGVAEGTFIDLFAGSGVVGKLAKSMGYRVIANDLEKYSEILNKNALSFNKKPVTDKEFDRINSLPTLSDGYMYMNYSPIGGRWFYTEENAQIIDTVREYCESLSDDKKIAVISSLLYRASIHSNTSGQFRAFHNGWGGSTKTNIKEITARIILTNPIYFDNGLENLVFCEDANTLAKNISGDIVYLDPPYNEHVYGSFYHILNTITLWDRPVVGLVTEKKRKAGLRKDVIKSQYNMQSQALASLDNLLLNIKARFIILSYSDQGHVSSEEMKRLVNQYGKNTWKEIPYRMYSSSKTRVSQNKRPHEYLITIQKG